MFWAIRGGTGNFGIVTELEFTLYPVREVFGGNLYYPLDRAREVLEYYAEWSLGAPDDLSSAVTFRGFPPLPFVPEQLRGKTVIALRGVFCGDPSFAENMVDRARKALGPAIVDSFTTMRVAALASISADPVEPLRGMNHSELLTELSPAVIDGLIEVAGPDAGSPLAMLEVRQLGGALTVPDGQLSPMAHTAAGYSLNAIGITPTRAHADAVRAHLAKVAMTMSPHATGETYLNFLDLEGATPERIRAAYSDADWHRLSRIKAKHDPHNLFRFNRNIPAPTRRPASNHPAAENEDLR